MQGQALGRHVDEQAGLHESAAAANYRRRQTEKVERREVIHTKETFGEFWPRWLERRRPYLEEGTWAAYERDGRLRLMPALESVPLERMQVELMNQMVELMESGELAPKTINNTLGTLVVALNAAVKEKPPCARPLRF